MTRHTETTYSQLTSLTRDRLNTTNAFLTLYDSHFSRVYNYVRYRCGDADIADDLTSIVFENALYNFHRYQPDRAPFYAWLFAIARNIVNSHFRQQNRSHTMSLDSLAEHPTEELLPEANLISNETSEELFQALDTLEERERDLLSLKFAAHLTNRRIAEISGLSEANVGVIIFRALKKLRKKLLAY